MTRLVGYLFLFLAIALWLPATCCAHSASHRSDLAYNAFERPTQVHASPSDGDIVRDDLVGNVPTASPSASPPSSGSSPDSLDFVVAAFFFIAAGWLLLAVVYSVLVLIVVHLRARGQLDVYDQNFGRFYLLGTRCYIPLGCILRRYVIALTQERDGHGDHGPFRLMTREERRMAMELLLASDEENIHNFDNVSKKEKNDDQIVLSNETGPKEIGHIDQFAEAKIEEEHVADDAFNDEPVCTICLDNYEPTDICFTSTVCPHRYHHGCIMDWLERRANTECPCCRTPLISDEEVWETVQKLRRERRKQIRKQSRGAGGLFAWFRHGKDSSGDEETVDPTPPPSPHASNLDDVEMGTENRVANDPCVMAVNSEDVTVEGRRLFDSN